VRPEDCWYIPGVHPSEMGSLLWGNSRSLPQNDLVSLMGFEPMAVRCSLRSEQRASPGSCNSGLLFCNPSGRGRALLLAPGSSLRSSGPLTPPFSGLSQRQLSSKGRLPRISLSIFFIEWIIFASSAPPLDPNTRPSRGGGWSESVPDSSNREAFPSRFPVWRLIPKDMLLIWLASP
jgi:hypothetical protein